MKKKARRHAGTKARTGKRRKAAAPAAAPAQSAPPTPEHAIDAGGLTFRQRQFVAALCGPAQGNATEAARLAGYSDSSRAVLATLASRLLTEPAVQEAISHELGRHRLSPEWAKASLADLAGASLAALLDVPEEGQPSMDWQKAARLGQLGIIKEYVEHLDKETGQVTQRTVKVHDRLAAINLLLQLHGLIKQRHEHAGKDGKPIPVTVVLERNLDLVREVEATVQTGETNER